MKCLGLLMINEENDILADVLRTHEWIVDGFYVLDGTTPNDESRRICEASQKCARYSTDQEAQGVYGGKPRDGWRQLIYEQAAGDHGSDNWFLLLHGDEVWTFDPHEVVQAKPSADGFVFRLPFYFPREEDGWDDTRPPLEQLHWHLSPGWPEFRMFRGGPNVHFDPGQHFDVTPRGLTNIVRCDMQIRHYPYRSPRSQHARAFATFDPDNYRFGPPLWTDEMIANAYCEHHRELHAA